MRSWIQTMSTRSGGSQEKRRVSKMASGSVAKKRTRGGCHGIQTTRTGATEYGVTRQRSRERLVVSEFYRSHRPPQWRPIVEPNCTHDRRSRNLTLVTMSPSQNSGKCQAPHTTPTASPVVSME